MNPAFSALYVSGHCSRRVLCLGFVWCIPPRLGNDQPIALNTGPVCRTVDAAARKEVGSEWLPGQCSLASIWSLNYFSCWFLRKGGSPEVILLCWHTGCLSIKTLSRYCCVSSSCKYAVNLFQNGNKASGLLRLG